MNAELIQKCKERVARIAQTNDDGLYAKAYAADVPLLIAEIDRLKDELEKTYEGEDCFRL